MIITPLNYKQQDSKVHHSQYIRSANAAGTDDITEPETTTKPEESSEQ